MGFWCDAPPPPVGREKQVRGAVADPWAPALPESTDGERLVTVMEP